MKKNSVIFYFSGILIISCISTGSVFAQKNTTNTTKNINASYAAIKQMGDWAYQLLSFDSASLVTVTEIESSPSKNDVLITWNADKLATGVIYYSTTSPVEVSSSTLWVAASVYANYAQSKANIRYLDAGTLYYYKLVTKDNSGIASISKELTFSTEK